MGCVDPNLEEKPTALESRDAVRTLVLHVGSDNITVKIFDGKDPDAIRFELSTDQHHALFDWTLACPYPSASDYAVGYVLTQLLIRYPSPYLGETDGKNLFMNKHWKILSDVVHDFAFPDYSDQVK